jgi:hypothetical protein
MNTNEAQAALKAAEAQLKQLRDAATLAESEAATAQMDFEEDPSESAFTAASVAKQRAANARKAADKYEKTELAQAREALRGAQRDAVAANLQAAERSITTKLTKATETMLAAIRQFNAAQEEAIAFEDARKEAASSGVTSSFSLANLMHQQTLSMNRTLGLVRTSTYVGNFGGSSPEEPVSSSVNGHAIRFRVLCGFSVNREAPAVSRTVPRFEEEAQPVAN